MACPPPQETTKRSATIHANPGGRTLKLKVIVHEAAEGGHWAEVPSILGCATQGETFEELLSNLSEAVEGCLAVDIENISLQEKDRVVEIAV